MKVAQVAVGSFQTLVPFYQTTQHHTSEDSNPHSGGKQNSKCHIRGIYGWSIWLSYAELLGCDEYCKRITELHFWNHFFLIFWSRNLSFLLRAWQSWCRLWTCTTTMCFSRCPRRRNFLLHTSHSNCLSPVWICMCFRKSFAEKKPLLQMEHTCGRSELWISKWHLKSVTLAYLLPQLSHGYGRSPVWKRYMCILRWLNNLKLFWHSSHL